LQFLMATDTAREATEQCDQPDELAQNDSQMAQDHADVVTAAAQDREEGVTGGALQRASGQAAIGLHVPDHRFDGASSSQQFRNGSGDAAPGAADEDPDSLDAMAAIAPIDEGHVRAPVGQDFHLFQRLVQGVAVVRVARHRSHAEDEAARRGDGDGDLRTELVALVHPPVESRILGERSCYHLAHDVRLESDMSERAPVLVNVDILLDVVRFEDINRNSLHRLLDSDADRSHETGRPGYGYVDQGEFIAMADGRNIREFTGINFAVVHYGHWILHFKRLVGYSAHRRYGSFTEEPKTFLNIFCPNAKNWFKERLIYRFGFADFGTIRL